MAEQNELRDKGLRLTPQRELVLQAVRDLGHATPEEVANKIHITHPGINLVTVARLTTPLKSSPTYIWSVVSAELSEMLPSKQPHHLCNNSQMIMVLELMSLTSQFMEHVHHVLLSLTPRFIYR